MNMKNLSAKFSLICAGKIRSSHIALVFSLVVLFGVGMLGLGFKLGMENVKYPEHQLTVSLRTLFDREQNRLDETKLRVESSIDAMALRLGEMESRLLRLDALGERLVELGDFDDGEFDFDSNPAMGGPESLDELEMDTSLPDLFNEISSLQTRLDDREMQLSLIEELIMHTNLDDAIHPAGKPINNGWISSYFGMRKDPFTGRRAMHKGMDFTGKAGSDVVAVADGVVTWAGDRNGYGNLIEINHGKGFVTRYGHNNKMLVQVGDRVRQGQAIALMGSSGRSTGPHVHFEVIRNGKTINPTKYIRAKRNESDTSTPPAS